MKKITSYQVNDYLLKHDGSLAMIDYRAKLDGLLPIDTSAEFLQSLLDELGLPFTVGARKGWREMGNEYSDWGYFEILPTEQQQQLSN